MMAYTNNYKMVEAGISCKRTTDSALQIHRHFNSLQNKDIFLGSFENLPAMNSRAIRIFLSSTFSDMAAERNILMKSIYPNIRLYCRDKYGIEFQMIDMRWGIREESQLGHEASDLCFQEVLNCQKISAGPCFVAILGQRYGNHPPPSKITKADILIIKEILAELNENLDVIEEWYLCDTNNIPEMFHLKPVVDVMHSENLDKKQIEQAKKAWYQAENEIQRKLEKAVTAGLQDNRMTKDQASTFSSSVTEKEIQLGILNAPPEYRDLSFTFIREIEDMVNQLSHPKTYKFIDLLADDSQAVDEKLRQKMSQLRNVEIPHAVDQSLIKKYSVQWIDGINENDHKDYLDTFARDFKEEICSLIDRAMNQKNQFQNDYLYTEVLQHSTACMNLVKHFQGRQDVLNQIKEYLLGDSKEPLIVYGASGSGKTSVLAKAASLCQSWLRENNRRCESSMCLLLVRFLGTSPGTCSVRQTLKYLCRQIVVALKLEDEVETVTNLNSFKEIKDKFYLLLESVDEKNRPVFIFLDSVDQLDSSDSSYQLNWLVNCLPEHVKLVLSTLPEMFGLLDTFKAKFPNPDCYIEVKPLEETLCSDILKTLLSEKGRQLTVKQWDIVRTAFKHCSLPIYVNLIFYQVLTWKSFDTGSHVLSIEPSVRGAIRHLFRNLEKKYGEIFTRHSLGYITASRNGLSEAELEDLLSLDNEVLRDVFQYHLPPLIRIPPFCWSRLRNDIGSYLVEREADNTRVLYWYHRQFIEVAKEYFLGEEQFLKKIHSNMADYFLGIWGGGRKKEFPYPANLIRKLGLPESSLEDRITPLQPYLLDSSSGEMERFNLRKLNELPYHLAHAGRFQEFYDNLAFDYNFLFNKLRSMSRFDLLVDLLLPSQLVPISDIPSELNKLINAIRISAQSLNTDPISLNTDLIARLFNFEKDSPRIQSLLQQCRSIARKDCALIPLHNCLESGSGALHTNIDLKIGFAFVTHEGLAIVLGLVDNDVRVMDLDGNELYSFTTPHNLIMCARYLFKTGIPHYMICNMTVAVTRDEADDRQNDTESDVSLICMRVNFKTGYSNVLFHFPSSWKNLNPSDIQHSGEHWILFSNKHGASLINIDKHELVSIINGPFKLLPNISDNENYFYYSDAEYHVSITCLGSGKCLELRSNEDHLSNRLIIGVAIQSHSMFILTQMKGNEVQLPLGLTIYELNVTDGCLTAKLVHEIDLNRSMPKVKTTKSFISSKYVIFLTTRSGLEDKICIFNRLDHKFVTVVDSKKLLQRIEISNFDEETNMKIIEDYDFLVVTIKNCLFGIFRLSDGQFIRKFKLGDAEGFIGGHAPRSNLLMISHFPDESETSEVDRMFIMGKVFDLDVIAEEEAGIDQGQNKDRQDENKFIFENKKTNVTFLPGRIDLLKKKGVGFSHLLDLKDFQCHLDISHSDEEINENFPLEADYKCPISDDDAKFGFNCSNEEDDDPSSINLYSRIPQTIRHAAYSNIFLNSEYFLPDLKSQFTWKIEARFENLSISQWEIQEGDKDENNSQTTPAIRFMRNISIENHDFGKDIENFSTPLYDKETVHDLIEANNRSNGIWNIRLVLERPSHPLQLIVLFTENLNIIEVAKIDNKALLYVGKVNIYDFNGISENDLDLPLLHSHMFDTGPAPSIFQDGVHVINYKLHIYNLENGNLMRKVCPLDSDFHLVLFANFLLTPDDKFVVGQYLTRPFKIKSLIDMEEDEMHNTPPPRLLQIYRLSDGQRIANYMFENEPYQLMTSSVGGLLVILTPKEIARVFRIDDGLNDEKIIDSSKTEFNEAKCETDSKVSIPKVNYLESIGIAPILCEAFSLVVDKRPADPIYFIANYLLSKRTSH